MGLKKFKVLIIALILLVSASAMAAEKWTDDDYALEGSYLALHFVDWRQTRTIAKNPDRYYEINPILGRHPSTTEVDIYFAATTLLHPIISHYLPQPYRKWFQSVSVILSGTCVVNNFVVGIKMDF